MYLWELKMPSRGTEECSLRPGNNIKKKKISFLKLVYNHSLIGRSTDRSEPTEFPPHPRKPQIGRTQREMRAKQRFPLWASTLHQYLRLLPHGEVRFPLCVPQMPYHLSQLQFCIYLCNVLLMPVSPIKQHWLFAYSFICWAPTVNQTRCEAKGKE